MWRDIGIPAFCVGVIAVFFVPAQMGAWWLLPIAVIIAALFFSCQFNSLNMVIWAMSALLLGGVYGYARTEIALSKQWAMPAASQTVNIVITGLPERDEFGRTRFIAQTQTVDGKYYRLLFQDYSKRDWQVGEHWRIKTRIRAAVGTRNLVGFDREAWALANGIDGMASVGKMRERLPETSWGGFNRLRANIVEQWQVASNTYPQGAALMKALAVGDDSGLPMAVFRPLGLNHLISISGLHISMIAVLAAWLMNLLMRWRTPRRPRVYALAVGWLAAAMYTGLAGFEIPALRSLLMLSVFMAAWIGRSAWRSWQIWWTALAVVLLYQPMSVLSVGFWLSFGLVGGLLWALSFRLPETGERSFWRHRYILLKQAIIGQWAATLIGGVATMHLFGLLPVFSPIVNAVAIPLFSWLLTPAALLASALPFDTPKITAAWLGDHTMHALQWLSTKLPEAPFAHSPAPLFCLALIATLLILLPNGLRIKPLAIIALGTFALYHPAPISGSLNATIWDVGQGLSVFIQTPNHNILFDTGTPAAELALLPNLRAIGIQQFDHVILSHHDDDHDGGYPLIQKNFPIKTLWAGQPEFYQGAQPCRAGTQWQMDGVSFAFLNLPPADAKNDNEYSCVLRVAANGNALLITGDISQRNETQLIEQYGESLHSNILILAHHGSKSSNSHAFIRAVSPQIAVASSGFANHFRHPHPDVQRRLAAHNVALLRTDKQGGIQFSFEQQNIAYQLLAKPKYWWQRKPFD